MGLIQCPECDAEISDRAGSCPRCGYPMQIPPPPPPVPEVTDTVRSQSQARHSCDICGEVLSSERTLYLHKVNTHGAYRTDVTSQPVPSGAARQAARIECPHCHVKGRVTTRQIKVKRGISGGKATGAVLTAGFSILATGLSRKEMVTEAHCGNCGVTWRI
jgi:transcription elongation factor Elf1